jgi:biopolymer transport protein ExbD
MAEKSRRSLDVWIVDSNTVYREVPYSVVTDWIQQGRLLEDDQVRLAGNEQWTRLAEVRSLASFLPKPDPHRIEDQAEALEPVEVDVAWRHHREEEDDEVDMIPLIDISLVLLIFFMLTSTVASGGALFDTPKAQYKLLTISADMVWLGLRPGSSGEVEYSFGKSDQDRGETFASRAEALQAFDHYLAEQKEPVKVNIRAHQKLPFADIRDLTVELEKYKRSGKVLDIVAEVSEKEGS